jgi:predicted enzyme involved in methoxymalonyl-ACP biosynthesis
VEVAVLAFLCDRARALGQREIRGRYIPTRKNAQAADFLAGHGFERRDDEWVADPSRTTVACPAWIRLTVAESALA